MSSSQTKEKRMNPFLWLLFDIIVPLIVAIIIAVVIMSIAGVNVGEWVKQTGSNIPIISNFIQTEEEKNMEELEQKFAQMMDEKDLHIASLESTIEEHAFTIEQLTEEVQMAETQLQNMEATVSQVEEVEEETAVPLLEMAASYEEMNHKQAARIMEEMDESIALALLHELPDDVRGKIFERMDPAKARELTESYIEQ